MGRGTWDVGRGTNTWANTLGALNTLFVGAVLMNMVKFKRAIQQQSVFGTEPQDMRRSEP